MNDIARIADQVRAQAERAEADAFDREYALGRRAERLLAAMTADGAARARQWAEDDRDEADRRFDPEPDEPEQPQSASPARTRSRLAAPETADDDEEDEPTTWLR